MSYRTRTMLLLSCCLMGSLMTACNDEGYEQGDEVDEVDSIGEASSALHAKAPTQKLMREWNQWALSEPWSTGPINDPTGAECAEGQDGKTWFLAGTSGGAATRQCSIPKGKDLFFPLVNRWCVFPSDWYPDQASIDADLVLIHEWYADQLANTCSLIVKVDGQDAYAGGLVEMVDDLYLQTPGLFQVDLNADNFLSDYGVPGGPMPASAAGHFARIKALPPGDHVVELGGAICDGEEVAFETSVTYHLHVAHKNHGNHGGHGNHGDDCDD